MPKGSFFCSSVGDSGLTALASLPKAAKMGSSSMPPGDGSGLLSRRMSKSMAAVVVVERGTAAAQDRRERACGANCKCSCDPRPSQR